jgi:hypothetical protein
MALHILGVSCTTYCNHLFLTYWSSKDIWIRYSVRGLVYYDEMLDQLVTNYPDILQKIVDANGCVVDDLRLRSRRRYEPLRRGFNREIQKPNSKTGLKL